VDEAGRPNFRDLLFRQSQCIFIAFDLLYLNGKEPDREVRHGSPLSGTRKTPCGRWIYFDASPQYYERTGFWS
jgi:hypothetical protein